MPRSRTAVANGLSAPFRLVFRRSPDVTADPAVPPATTTIHDVEFVGYAEDCMVSGRVALSAERLSDLLNEHERFELVDVLVSPLNGGSPFELREMLIERDEIMLVHAMGPRGNAGRRQRTRQFPIVVKAGPYEIHGYVHATPGSDPIASLRRRKPMVALTDAVIRYSLGSQPQARRVATVIVNRETVDWIVEGEDESVATLDMPVDAGGPLLKDFTGELLA
ncbi:MAG: hypothetical protein QOF49_1925 [Chloroflexota bacterium]|jgi:hypothetical protein|nr:hypothetical protein [Chloroflexota bacterium]